MLLANLSGDMAAHVRESARRFGLAALRPGLIAQPFNGRAGSRTLYRMAADAIRDFKESVAKAVAANSPAAREPLKMFDCEPQRMRLTVGGCARLWRGAQERRPGAWEGRHACVACPVGAKHAGINISPVARETEVLRTVCCRCQKPAMRLINNRHCISCYNRHAEALKGKNARGGRPALCDHLREVGVAVSAGDDVRVEIEPFVTGAAEVLIDRARKADGIMCFGWAISGPGETVDMAA